MMSSLGRYPPEDSHYAWTSFWGSRHIDSYEKACKYFGDVIATKHLRTLPVENTNETKKLEDLWDKGELNRIRQRLGLPANKPFEKIIMAVFYDECRDQILDELAIKTRKNFIKVLDHIEL